VSPAEANAPEKTAGAKKPTFKSTPSITR